MFKSSFIGSVEAIKVYPINILSHLIFVGLPCIVLSIIQLSKESDTGEAGLGIAIYSGLVLCFQGLIDRILSTISSVFTARLNGPAHLINESVVINVFGYTEFFSRIALVLLLIVCVAEYFKKYETSM